MLKHEKNGVKRRDFLCLTGCAGVAGKWQLAGRIYRSEGTLPQDAGFAGHLLRLVDPDFYPDRVAYLDHLVGRLMTALERAGLRDSTLVIFTGDNGTNVKVAIQTKPG